MTEENRAAFESAIQSGKVIKWSYDSDRAKKYGVSSIEVGVLDKSARLIPDIALTIQVN